MTAKRKRGRPPTSWSSAQDAVVADTSLTHAEVAKKLGRAKNACIRRAARINIKREAGLKKTSAPRTPRTRRILRLYQTGVTRTDIARRVGVTQQAVSCVVSRWKDRA